MTNPYCKPIGIDVPSLDDVERQPRVPTNGLLILALLEHGGPLTLEQAAERFKATGKRDLSRPLRSLKHCRPATPPVFRKGDHYHLDVDDENLGPWLFRLGLREPEPSEKPQRSSAPAPPAEPRDMITGCMIIHVFPAEQPRAAVVVDVQERSLEFLFDDEVKQIGDRIANSTIIGALNVRPTLKALDIDPGPRHLVELSTPQKSKTLNRAGRKLKITTEMLIQQSCSISRPLGDKKKMRGYLRDGQTTKLRRRMESDAKALTAMYHYACLHGGLRLRWGFLNEMIWVPWLDYRDWTLFPMLLEAHERELPIDAVTGSAPGWDEPWTRARRCRVQYTRSPDYILITSDGRALAREDVQLARLVTNTTPDLPTPQDPE